ncbi:MAG: arsenate reductase (glutaredoxin) [Bacteroidota bacterium]
MKIYHNPRCRKSRETLALIKEKGIEPEIVLYLNTPPNKKELQTIVEQLGIQPSQLIRKSEKVYKENYKGRKLSEEEWLAAMIQYPKLIERPIVLKNGRAILGRPPENVLELL